MNALLRILPVLALTAIRASAISVAGTVTTDGGTALSGVTLTIEQVGGELPPLTATTAANGSYSVSDPLLFGNVRVTAAKSGFTFEPSVRESFTSANLNAQNFTAISTGKLRVFTDTPHVPVPKGHTATLPDVVVPGSSAISFLLHSAGTGPLTGLSVSFTGPAASHFSLFSSVPATLAAREFSLITVTAAPLTTGTHTAAMQIASSDSTDNPFTINLTVTAFPTVTVSNLNDSGPGSLRTALANAAAHPGLDKLRFAPGVLGQTITLDSEITVSDSGGVLIAPDFEGPLPAQITESFDNSSGGWTETSNFPFEGPWTYNPTTGAWSTAGQESHIASDPVTRLTSPEFIVPKSGEVILTVRHRYRFEDAFDGGQLRVASPVTDFAPVTEFLEGGHNGTVPSGEVRGQPGFVGTSPGYADQTMITTRAFAGYLQAGQIIRLQFIAAFDESVAAGRPAWEIDSVSIAVLPGGRSGVTLSGGPGANRLIHNTAGSFLELRRLTLTGGHGGGATPAGGGALLNSGRVTLNACTFHGNSSGPAGDGGAVCNATGATMTASRCTFANNTSPAGRGGAIGSTGPFTLTHCTIAGNSAQSAGGGLITERVATLTNCILANNSLTGGGANDLHTTVTVTCEGTNILPALSTNNGSLRDNGLRLTGDPRLSPLLDCGGPTPTMALRPGSLARNVSIISPSFIDQRGYRVVNTPDAGAYEAVGSTDNFNAWIQERLPTGASDAGHGPDADFDSDGQTNETEFLTLTDPASPGSRFEPVLLPASASFDLTFSSARGRTYTLMESDSLAPGSWAPAPGTAVLTGNNTLLSFTVPASAARRFFQVAPSLPQ